MSNIQNSKDLILHFLYSPGLSLKECEEIKGRTRLQKMIFLFEKEIWKKFKSDQSISEDILPEFQAYDFGPFSKQVYDDLEFLINHKLVDVSSGNDEDNISSAELRFFLEDIPRDESSKAVSEESFTLTNLGKKFVVSGGAGKLTTNQKKVLSDFKCKVNSVPLNVLLEYVYTKYPAMTVKSKIKDQVLSKKKLVEDIF